MGFIHLQHTSQRGLATFQVLERHTWPAVSILVRRTLENKQDLPGWGAGYVRDRFCMGMGPGRGKQEYGGQRRGERWSGAEGWPVRGGREDKIGYQEAASGQTTYSLHLKRSRNHGRIISCGLTASDCGFSHAFQARLRDVWTAQRSLWRVVSVSHGRQAKSITTLSPSPPPALGSRGEQIK